MLMRVQPLQIKHEFANLKIVLDQNPTLGSIFQPQTGRCPNSKATDTNKKAAEVVPTCSPDERQRDKGFQLGQPEKESVCADANVDGYSVS